MKTNVVVLYGALFSGKTDFTQKLEDYFLVVNTDELYTVETVRFYDVATGKKGVETQTKSDVGFIPDSSKIRLLESLFESHNNIVIEGKRFFSNYMLEYLCSHEDIDLTLIFTVYEPGLCEERFKSKGLTMKEYYSSEDTVEYECFGRFCNIYENISEKYPNVDTHLVDVSDEHSWDDIDELIKSKLTTEEVIKNKPNIKADLEQIMSESQDTGVNEIELAIRKAMEKFGVPQPNQEPHKVEHKSKQAESKEKLEQHNQLKEDIPEKSKKSKKSKQTNHINEIVISEQPEHNKDKLEELEELIKLKVVLDNNVKEARKTGTEQDIKEARSKRRKTRNKINKLKAELGVE